MTIVASRPASGIIERGDTVGFATDYARRVSGRGSAVGPPRTARCLRPGNCDWANLGPMLYHRPAPAHAMPLTTDISFDWNELGSGM